MSRCQTKALSAFFERPSTNVPAGLGKKEANENSRLKTPDGSKKQRALERANCYLRNMNYRNFIEIRPDKRFGKPCLKGTRISVYDVLNWLANGMDAEAIKSDFEEITDEMIHACLAFAADRERNFRISS